MKIVTQNLMLIAFFLSFTSNNILAQSNKVIITEFMAINSNGLVDEDNEHSDWLEIYNNTDNTIDLAGWYLTDNPNTLKEWQFPSVTLPKNGYLVIFASGKNRTDPTKNLHTNFKLSGSGEYLAICEPDTTISFAYSPAFPAQRQDVSYGFYQGQEVFFTSTTPGAENVAGNLPFAPNFSATRGFYNSAFDVALSLPGGDGQIYYTINGTRPSKTSGTPYSTPIHIPTTTPLSAVTIKTDGTSSEIVTHTYIFPADVVKQPIAPAGYPTNWKQATSSTTIKADYEMDPAVCNSAEYKNYMDPALKSIPTMSIVTTKDYLFSDVNNATNGGIYIYTGRPSGTGADWVRPTSIEYFDPNTGKTFQANCRLKLHGGNSRNPGNCPKHGFELTFKSEYGPSKLNFDMFEEKKSAKEFNTLILRGGYNYTWVKNSATQQSMAQYIQDSWAKTTQLDMGYLSGHERFVNLYINGLYWGMYNVAEQYDDHFVESYLGGDQSEFDIIKEQQYGYPGVTEPTAGTFDAWKELLSQVQTNNIGNNVNYQTIQGKNADGTINASYANLLDVDNYIDYMLINYYLGNLDWDKNNWTAVRNRISNENGFRFICWDAETTMASISTNMVSSGPTSGNPTAFMQYLKKNPDFLVKMADHIQQRMINVGGELTPKVITERYEKLAGEIELAIICESARWGDWYNNTGPYTKNEHWIPRKNDLLNNYFPFRTDTVLMQLREAGYFPSVDAPVFSFEEGTYPAAIQLGMTNNKGTIYYTTNGTDPRVEITGNISSSAMAFSSNVNISDSTVVKARAKSGTEWSAISEAKYIISSLNGINNPTDALFNGRSYPNPFTSETQIQFTLTIAGHLKVDIYNIDGRLVQTLFDQDAFSGQQNLYWKAENEKSGMYICRITFNGQNTYLKLLKK